jgi:hypothetical protein
MGRSWMKEIAALEERLGDVEDVQLEDGARIDFHDARLEHLERAAGIELARLDPDHPIHRLRARVAARRAERDKK